MLERRFGITSKEKQTERQKAYTPPLARGRCNAYGCALKGGDAAGVQAGSGVDTGAAKLTDSADDGAADSGAAKLVDSAHDSVAEDGSGAAELDDKVDGGATELG